MPLTRLVADVLGVVTISLVCLHAVLGLFCIYRSVYFWLRIRKGNFLQLGYFNGPWVTRIVLILVAIWWCVGEIIRLSLLKGKGRLFSSLIWQRNICKFYILSNLGFAEPIMFLALVFLLHASLQKRESGALSQSWNRRTLCYVFLSCLPIFIMQVVLVFVGPRLSGEERSDGRMKMPKYFTRTSYLTKDSSICTYPLIGTIFLGLFDVFLISYVVYVGMRMLSLVINKRLRRRIYWLISVVIVLLPLRIILLGFSVLPHPGKLAYESMVFLAFVMLICCSTVGIYMLVYCPVADSLELRNVRRIEMDWMPYDDYYSEGASLVANRSLHGVGRNSDDTSTKHGSVSFRTLIKDDLPASDGLNETTFSSFRTLVASPSGSPLHTGRHMLSPRELPKF